MEIDVPKIDQFLEEQMVNAHGHSHGGGGGGNGHLQYERNLNFATVAVEDNEYGFPKKKTVRDPLSHRIIEKRRRDRMNNCLADLARLLPASSLRKGRGRIEKTEIVELAIKHLKHLQTHPCPQSDACEFTQMARNQKSSSKTSSSSSASSRSCGSNQQDENFRLGFQECLSEALHFLVETEGMYPGDDLCVRLMKHLNSHCENLMRDHLRNNGKHSVFTSNSRKIMEVAESFKNKESCSGGSSSSGYQAHGSSSGSDANGGNDGEGSLTNEPFTLPPANHHFNSSERMPNTFDYEGDNNSCSSTPLSIEISDVLSSDGKNANRSSNKPPIPAIIGSGNSSNNSRSPAVLSSSNGRSSDEGSSSLHRYKFKNNINRRFNADLQTKYGSDENNCLPQENDASVEDTDQNMDDSDCKLESCTLQRNPSSNCSNMDSEPATCVENTSSATILSSHNDPSCIPTGLSTFSPGLVSSQDEKKVVDHFDQKPTTEELLASVKPLDCDNVALIPKTAMPIINAATILSSGPDIPPLPLPLPTTGALGSTGVPAFALHDKGLYYIPLTIDKSIVSPFIAAMEPNTQPPLHPVTISVCFLLSAGETQGKLKNPPGLSREMNPIVPVSVPISIPLPMTVANITPIVPLLKAPKGLSRGDHTTNFIMNRFTQSQQCNPKLYSRTGSSNNSSNAYRYPAGINGGGGSSVSSGSYSPVNNLITYPVLYGTNSPHGTINFGQHGTGSSSHRHNNNGNSGSHHHHSGSNLNNHHSSSYHSNYYNHSSSSASNCSGGNNSDNNSWGKNVRSSNSSGSNVGSIGRINDGNNPTIHVSNSNANSSSSSSGNGSLNGKGSSNSSSSSNSGNSGHSSSSSRSSAGICPSSRQSRKRSVSSSPSVSGSALSTSTGYHSWNDKASSSALSVSSADNSYHSHSHGISLALNDQQINYNDSSSGAGGNNTHHYGHLHPHSHGNAVHGGHGHSHIHPQYSSHAHSHSHAHPMNHSHHNDDKEQERTKGRLSPNKRAKKFRSLEQEIQHKHSLAVHEVTINR